MTGTAALAVRQLSVAYRRADGLLDTVVSGVDLDLQPGRITGLAGESGCGKSTTALAAIGYRTPGMQILGGEASFEGVDLLSASTTELRRLWGRGICYVPQAAAMSLNPGITVGAHLAEPLTRHLGLSDGRLRERQLELLEQVGLPSPEAALNRYPHQFSGGQQQRINLALALSCNPTVMLLDEPTTGLDVTTQARISALLTRLVGELGLAALYVSHDLGLLGSVADRIVVMYGGQVIEQGRARDVVERPRHPYARALLAAAPNPYRPHALRGIPGQPPSTVVKDACPFVPRCTHAVDGCRSGNPPLLELEGDRAVRCIRAHEISHERVPRLEVARPAGAGGELVLDVDGVSCAYESRRGPVQVVDAVSLEVGHGETVGIAGESGSGKSTLLRAIAGLHPWSAGTIRFDGTGLAPRAAQRSRTVRRDVQLVFQNPDLSLNPRHTVMQIVGRSLRLFRSDVPREHEIEEVQRSLDAVKLPRSLLYRYPSELSGGQKQRVALARAFAARPRLLLCDEVTSALDVSVQAAILELIADLSERNGTAVVFVTHDLGVVRTVAHRTLVMRGGSVCESNETEALFTAPSHPYTRELLHSVMSVSRHLDGEPAQAG
ncbi:MAG TPA: ABC transporter ATP-binding protein [Solirubrobacteraceae bacterium]|nr:ABC transporter ATP-binding protein [Solirubrobacteraceae bacterium]